ncbi:glycosyltransferase [Spiribacter roseus]|uniref:Glycosyltransferase n=1 Tax=Spiribacter roseus TaxID=1855875 RepID=A0ABV3RZX4_9GAMM
MTIVFFNPYADPGVKGSTRRIEFLQHLLNLLGVPSQAVLAQEYAMIPKSLAERAALRFGLRRLAYFLQIWRLCQSPDTTVISEVIFSPTWHPNMVLTVHDLKVYDERATRGGRFRHWAYGLFTRLARRIVVVSESVRDDMQRLCGVPPERIHVVPNGISKDRIALAAYSMRQTARYDFVYVSTFAEHKRHALLLRAAPAGSRLCLIGRGGGALDETKTEALRRAEQIKVDIFENVDTDAQLFQLLGAARCGVFPSVFEGFGIPLLEYGAAGLYVIASDIPPFRELSVYVDRFVPPDDEQALHKAMSEFMHRPDGVSALAVDRVASSSYTEEAIAIRLAKLLSIPISPVNKPMYAGPIK